MLRRILTYCTLPLLLLLSSGNSATTAAQEAPEGFNPGPDIITGDIGLFGGLEQFGSSGTQVGLAPSTTSCNAGDQVVNFFMLPDTTHPVIPHNLYRMSGGPGNDERFEQIGQGWPKHAFGADQASDCFTCQPGGNFSHLGVGCSDTYANFQNAEQGDLGSRALINPFTGEFQPTANNHSGHVHTGTSHRILVEGSDLNTTLNPGATYYAEVQYISSDEYAWCQSHAGQCNMYNNASYKRYNVSGTTSFTFAEVGNTVRMAAAVTAWPGATINPIEPAPGSDGRAYIAYKVTNPSAGVWHYEYAIYNENLDRAIQSFSLPSVLGGPGCGFSVANVGFHAPPNHPGFPNDGTQGGAGFSNTPWNFGPDPTGLGGFAWFTETMVQNPNANAIRWGTLYNFRFDSNKPPIAGNAIIGFFKTGEPVTVAIMSPNACDGVTPTPTPSATPSATPSPTATPSATVTPGASATPTATATPSVTPSPTAAAQPLNFSTRMLVQTGDNVGIGGFIIAGSSPKHVVVQAVGGLSVPGTLADPVLELHGPPGFVTITNDNCPGGQFPPPPPFCQPGSLNAAIDATLAPGAYTAIVKGKDNTSGVALVEVYDFNSAVDSKLANISTRAIVGTAENIVIAGFILGPNTGNGRILVRGIGPSLGNFGIANPLADPTLELRDNNGVLLAFNNDWQDPPIPPPIPPQLQPGNPLESVIVALLPPGAYTALLAGRNNGTGVGLIEVYDIGVP